MPDLVRSAIVTARKMHRCQCCGSPAIQPGETYERQTLVYDRRIYDWVSCIACTEIRGQVADWAIDEDEGVGRDEYYSWANEHTDDPAHGDNAKAYLLRADL